MSRLIGWYSCGAASATAIKIMLSDAEFLADFDEVVIAYCHIEEEHKDNMRFLKECETWFGQEILILKNEHYQGSIYNVFETNYMRTPKGSPCTRALKKEVRGRFQRDDDVHVFGYTLDEQKRANDFDDRNKELDTEWVLINKNISKENCLAMVQRAGIKLPVMYELGYEHNNFVGCVKGGMGYWNKIRVDFPHVFIRMAKFERRKGYTVLKEPKTGEPLYLDKLDPKRGNMKDEPQIECGFSCELEENKYNQLERII